MANKIKYFEECHLEQIKRIISEYEKLQILELYLNELDEIHFKIKYEISKSEMEQNKYIPNLEKKIHKFIKNELKLKNFNGCMLWKHSWYEPVNKNTNGLTYKKNMPSADLIKMCCIDGIKREIYNFQIGVK